MAYSLFLTVRPTPDPQNISELRELLEASFSHHENQTYFQAFSGRPNSPALPRVVAQRLGALSLLPSLLSSAGIPPDLLILRRDSYGRPFLDTSRTAQVGIDFNLSHTANYVAAALLIGDGKVGVDIEDSIPPKRAMSLIQRYCTPEELRTLDDCMLDEKVIADRFTSIWVKKEAMSKQHGEGMPLRYDATRPPKNVRLWSGALSDSKAKIAVCAPLEEAPLIPCVLADSIPLDIQ